ncbi:MAG: periplasmic flagellar collar protein FlcA, partial [Spirochaetia bacterium]
LVLGVISWLSYTFIYQPAYAHYLYTRGIDHIEEDRYIEGNETFDRAQDVWHSRSQYYNYADTFRDERQYGLATEKYEELLEIYPTDRQGLLDYADLESNVLANYEHADQLLDRVLEEEMFDYDAMLMKGDNYMAWADIDPTRYEDARRVYATLMEQYGRTNTLLFRMLRYFIRTDNYDRVVELKDFFQSEEEIPIEPDVYAELGGYLLDNNITEEVSEILFRAMDVNESLPEVHYHLARYYREIENLSEERRALGYARRLFENATPLTRRRLAMQIDTFNRSGEVEYERREYLTAEEFYQEGIDLYENALQRELLEQDRMFGRLYYNLGNLYYYQVGEFDTALALFEEAEDNLYQNADQNYKMGVIRYMNENYDSALEEFYTAASPYSTNRNLLFSTGNSLFERRSYFSAQGYYIHLLDILERERQNITYLMINENPNHRNLIEYLMKTYNNLGVTFYRLYEAGGGEDYYSRALTNLYYASELFDALSRNPATLERSSTTNLAHLNSRSIMYPGAENTPSIYTDLPMDMQVEDF